MGALRSGCDTGRGRSRHALHPSLKPSHDVFARVCACIAELIRSKGDTNMTVEQLTQEIIPQGRGTVPDEIKAELLQRIRRFAEQQA